MQEVRVVLRVCIMRLNKEGTAACERAPAEGGVGARCAAASVPEDDDSTRASRMQIMTAQLNVTETAITTVRHCSVL